MRAVVRGLPRPRTMRARLTAGLVVLLAVSCAAVGVAAVYELNGFLTGRLDQQLHDVGVRFPASLEHGATHPGRTTTETNTATHAGRAPAPSARGWSAGTSPTRRSSPPARTPPTST
ncbi:hypothetical protein SAVCW2_10240 [Streptomyces avermitilis]|nr:hypothetical protein SAVCW2_10240 [Streptomyces avermitilis]